MAGWPEKQKAARRKCRLFRSSTAPDMRRGGVRTSAVSSKRITSSCRCKREMRCFSIRRSRRQSRQRRRAIHFPPISITTRPKAASPRGRSPLFLDRPTCRCFRGWNTTPTPRESRKTPRARGAAKRGCAPKTTSSHLPKWVSTKAGRSLKSANAIWCGISASVFLR